jgi:hypothetical protein
VTEPTPRPTTLREAVECLSNIDFSSAVLDTKEPIHDLIPCDVLEQAVKAHDVLVAAAEQLVAEFDRWGEVLQLGHDDDDGMYGPTSAIEQLRTALVKN